MDGDAAGAVEVMFDEHHDAVWAFVYRLAGAGFADDVTAEVFCLALRRFSSFDPERGPARSWLYGVAVNPVRNLRRHEAQVAATQRRVAGQRAIPGLGPASQTITRLVASELRAAVRAAISGLSLEQREVVVLVLWEELSYLDAADVVGVPVGTVRSRLARARMKLQEELGRSGIIVGDIGD